MLQDQTMPMMGLQSAVPEMDANEPPDAGLGSAVAVLQNAIALHERHMNGTEPPTPESQQQLMNALNTVFQLLMVGQGV